MFANDYIITFIDDGDMGFQACSNEHDALEYANYLKQFEEITFISVRDGNEREIERFEKRPCTEF